MNGMLFRTLTALLLLCAVLLQASPVFADSGVQIYTTEMQTAALSPYAFHTETVDFSVSHLFYDQLKTDDQRALYARFLDVTPADGSITVTLAELPALPALDHPDFQAVLAAHLSELVLPAFAAATQDSPMLFWTSSIGYSCSYLIRGDELISIDVICSPIPDAGFTPSNNSTSLNKILDVLNGIAFDGKSDRELLLQFHDYLCANIVYAESAHAHNIYGALVDGEAVCEGYAKAFKLFCDLYDIPCMLITGDALTGTSYGPHAWNAVRMEDGSWYAVDVTWDDQGEIYYDFFLIGSTSVPTSFEALTFAQSHIESGDFYGNGSVYMNFPTLSDTAYTHTHSYDEGTVAVQPSCIQTGTITYACLMCDATYSETLPTVAHSYANGACSVCGAAAPAFIYGDCNGDGKINGQDTTRLLRYLAGYNPVTGESSVELSQGADVNGDGKINGQDTTRLLRYLAGYNPVTGESSVTLGKA